MASSSSTQAPNTAAPPPPASQSPRYICIECTYPVASLYTAYSSADDRQLGRGVRLTQCPRCRRFADKYVEHDFVVLFIDLVLIKPQVYRHLLFNRLGKVDDSLDPSIIRLGILLLLFDVYLTWVRIEKVLATEVGGAGSAVMLSHPIVIQYLFFLILCLTESVVFHFTIRLLAKYILGFKRPNAVSTALLVSSCTKLFPILMVIWKYDVPAAARSVGWAVVVNNVEALRILLGSDYFHAGGLAAAGAIVRSLASRAILRSVGLWRGGGWVWEDVSWGEWVGLVGLAK
ncbi:Arv1-domain-containing protein [Ascodesmis nigricans]|uniref:Protein ARV n=1 Tax=Ascodesmis nigricans TaxID=341454 RepID=A0A4S2N1D2_9PEZI|nr:Arv1-domain-containing protein [Ascodesmis nigricans]